MPTRTDIQRTLAESQEHIIAFFQGMTPEDRERPCTASGVPGEAPWRPKDHLAHFAANERGIQFLINGLLKGETTMLSSLGNMSNEERAAWGNQRNQTYINEHRTDTLETLFAELEKARGETLALLASTTDEQLTTPVGFFGTDRTVGDLFLLNAQHGTQHMHWIQEGFQQE